MYVQLSKENPLSVFLKALCIFSLFSVFTSISIESSQAQTYSKRQQQIRYYRYQKKLRQQQVRQHYRQKARQRTNHKPQSKGLLDDLFGNPTPKRRYTRSRPRRAPTSHRPQRILQKARTLPKPRSKRAHKIKRKKSHASYLPYGKKARSKAQRLPRSFDQASRKKGKRAMCVRLCDGFYWPIRKIDKATRKSSYETLCQNSCTSKTSVYYARYSNDTAMSMRNRHGSRYRDLKKAFHYRKHYVKSCQCRPEPWTAAGKDAIEKRQDAARQKIRKSQKAAFKGIFKKPALPEKKRVAAFKSTIDPAQNKRK